MMLKDDCFSNSFTPDRCSFFPVCCEKVFIKKWHVFFWVITIFVNYHTFLYGILTRRNPYPSKFIRKYIYSNFLKLKFLIYVWILRQKFRRSVDEISFRRLSTVWFFSIGPSKSFHPSTQCGHLLNLSVPYFRVDKGA